ncbi:unnamed protein product [Lathyrus oleraceus]
MSWIFLFFCGYNKSSHKEEKSS